MAFPLYKCSLSIAAGMKVGSPSGIALVITDSALPSSLLDADGANPCQDGGGDLLAYADEALTTRIPLDVVSCVTANDPLDGEAQIVVAFDDLVSDTFWLAWGSDEGAKSQPAANDTYGRYNVYDSSAIGSWVFEEDTSGSAPQLLDRTANARHGTSAGSMTSGDLLAAKIGDGWDFDGTDDQVSCGNIATIRAAMIWMRHDSPLKNFSRPFDWGINGLTAFVFSNGNIQVYYNGTSIGTYASLSVNTWHHLAIVFNSGTVKGYIDGVERISGSATLNDTSKEWIFADIGGGVVQKWDGLLDQAHLFNVARSANDIATLYNCENDNAAFWDTGEVQELISPVAAQVLVFEKRERVAALDPRVRIAVLDRRERSVRL